MKKPDLPDPVPGRGPRLATFATAVLALFSIAAAAGAQTPPLSSLDPKTFPVPDVLAPNVAFWTKVYTAYDSDTVLVHDNLHLGVIYAAVDLSAINERKIPEAQKALLRRTELRDVTSRYRTILQYLAAGKTLSGHADEQARIARAFAHVPGGRGKYTAAIERIRTQTCLKNRFAEGIERSGLYMAEIEKIFRSRGLPVELTRLPFVESLFQWHAHSTARALGIWQFVPATAQYYLEMEPEFDERLDPLRASVAAAEFLEGNYRALGTWPLALTAYNHGRAGMKRAVAKLGTRDLGVIARNYRSRTFGFASRNFYAEFLAAATIYENRHYFFPGVEPLPALRIERFAPELYVPLGDLARAAGVEERRLRELNPALSSDVWSGDLYLPKGYSLVVPAGRREAFERAFAELPADRKLPHQAGRTYRVRRGDTLSIIARKFGTSASSVQRANRISNPHRIRIGQELLIPARGSRGTTTRTAAATPTTAPTAAPAPAPPLPRVHVVRSGETLSTIASRYGTSVRALQASNSLRGDRIHPGQKLKVPADGRVVHVVSSGETLAAIARRYGTTVEAVQKANRIRNHLIRPRQVLVIP